MALDYITSFKYYVKSELFDQMIVPILLYGSEMWGAHNIKQIEMFQILETFAANKQKHCRLHCIWWAGKLNRIINITFK